MAKEGYKPTSGMQSAARRALKWKEEGKAKGAGTAVGWTRAGQLSRGESLSLDTVKRMYSFFSRHEVDKKGKGFFDGPEFPSNGRIMWDAWGGDGGFSWSRSIVNREKKAGEMKKALVANDLVEEIKSILDDVINPITIEKAVKPEVSKETLLEIIKELQEIIVGMVEIEEEEPEEEEMEQPEMEAPEAPESVGNEIEDANNMRNTWPMAKSSDEEKEDKEEIYKTDDPEDKWDNEMQKCWTGYRQDGMKEKGGRMVPNCVPVEKAEDLTEADLVTKSLWSGTFLK
jgi:hypothetical protein